MSDQTVHSFIRFTVFWSYYFTRSRIEHDTTELAFLELHWLLDTRRARSRSREIVFERKYSRDDSIYGRRKTYNDYSMSKAEMEWEEISFTRKTTCISAH